MPSFGLKRHKTKGPEYSTADPRADRPAASGARADCVSPFSSTGAIPAVAARGSIPAT